MYRRLLALTLEELRLIETQRDHIDRDLAQLLAPHQDAIERLAEVPGLGQYCSFNVP